MGTWIDPKEGDERAWGETSSSGRRGEAVHSVFERAFHTVVPYEFRNDATYGPTVVEAEFETRDFRHARLFFQGSIQENRRVKLLVKGHLWGENERHFRFRTQVRRPAPPTETVPFDEYTVWSRYRYGTVHREEGTIQFEPSDEEPAENTTDRGWDDLRSPVQYRIAELELVRNPALARYVLRDLDEWDDVGEYLRWHPEAFEYPP